MRLIVICLAVFTTLAFSVDFSSLEGSNSGNPSYSPLMDDVIFAQTYLVDSVRNGYRHGAICDDFIISDDATATAVRFWIIYLGSAPIDYTLTIALDDGTMDPNTASIIWMETAPAVLTFTGDTLFTIDALCYQVDCAFSAGPSLDASERYWMEINFHDDAVTDYMVMGSPRFGSLAWTFDGTIWIRVDDPSTFEGQREMFFDMFGLYDAFDNETWGAIKSTF